MGSVSEAAAEALLSQHNLGGRQVKLSSTDFSCVLAEELSQTRRELSGEAWDAFISDAITTFDTDGDGQLNWDEWMSFYAERLISADSIRRYEDDIRRRDWSRAVETAKRAQAAVEQEMRDLVRSSSSSVTLEESLPKRRISARHQQGSNHH